MDTKIIERIQKLLALSESSNENEAQVALVKAQELLVRHKLSMKEVKDYKVSNSAIKEKISNTSFTKAKWKAKLGQLIADNFGCYIYFKSNRSHTIAFFGREEDILVCSIVLEYAIDTINSNVNRLRYQYYKNGYSTKGLENDYALGFICGLHEKFEEQKKKNQEWGLVLVKDKEVVESYNNIQFTGSINTNSTFKGHKKAYMEGMEEGGKFSISDKVAEGKSEEQLSLDEKENPLNAIKKYIDSKNYSTISVDELLDYYKSHYSQGKREKKDFDNICENCIDYIKKIVD